MSPRWPRQMAEASQGETAPLWCLYRLPQLTQADPATPVLLVEGEKDVQTVERLGYLATTSPGGAKNWQDRYAPPLAGRTVIIVPDNDSDGERYCKDAGASLLAVGCTVKVCRLPGLPDKGDVSDWLLQMGHTKDDLQGQLDQAEAWTPAPTVWDQAVAATEFVQQPDDYHQSLVSDLLYPGAITIIASPRGSGKSMTALALAIAAASGGIFREQILHACRVLLIDRDNPASIIRERLRNWGVEGAETLRVLTRTHAPSLTDRKAWETFPAEQYNVVIIDSLGSATEGVSEKEGKQTQQFLATLKDLAHKGPAILGLDNTNKSGESYRGPGEKADAVDVLYEVRDATGWTPANPDEWWLDLPEAGDHAWASRASRRRGQVKLRLAFIPSKFRLGIQPQPFVLELDLSTVPYTLADITDTLTQAAVDAARHRKAALQQQFEQASDALLAEVQRYAPDDPLLRTAGEQFLMTQGVSRKIARNLLEAFDADTHPAEGRWVLHPIPGKKGNPIGIYPVGVGNGGTNDQGACTPAQHQEKSISDFCRSHKDVSAEIRHSESLIDTHDSELPISADTVASSRQKSPMSPASNGKGSRDAPLFVPPQAHQRGDEPEPGWEEGEV